MTAPVERSDRRSDRVDNRTDIPQEARMHPRISAPESMSHPVGVLLSPEGRAQPNRRHGGRRTTRQRLLLTDRDLTDRERSILQAVSDHHFLTTQQIRRLFFIDHASVSAGVRICNRTLGRLDRLRVIEHLERRIGGIRAGSASYVWRVGLVGDQLLRLSTGLGVRARRKEPSERYLDHCLAGGDLRVRLVEAERTGDIGLATIETEPSCWRSYLGSSGARLTLKPDLYIETSSGEYDDLWFIEIDRATESLPTLIRKCQQYASYRRTGVEQRDRGVFPVVVWVVPDDIRANRLRAAIRTASGLDRDLFRVATSDNVVALVIGASS